MGYSFHLLVEEEVLVHSVFVRFMRAEDLSYLLKSLLFHEKKSRITFVLDVK
jgi:hypothetical protein